MGTDQSVTLSVLIRVIRVIRGEITMPTRPKAYHAGRPRAAPLRLSAAERGYGSRWRRAAKLFLLAHPLCAECLSHGQTIPAKVVDHVRPHKGDQALFWDEGNWQPLCKPCHDRKTATEDGGFGHCARRSSP
jgi:5-methylcytosine-specific restriction protein A